MKICTAVLELLYVGRRKAKRHIFATFHCECTKKRKQNVIHSSGVDCKTKTRKMAFP
jgi:hypothetical protein